MAKLSTNVSPNNFQLHPSPFLHRNSIINWNNKVLERNCRLKRSVSAIQIITMTVAVTNRQSLTDQQGQAQWLHWVIHHLLTLTEFPAAETASFDYLTFLPKIPRECSDGTEQRIAGCGGHHPPYHSARQQESITLLMVLSSTDPFQGLLSDLVWHTIHSFTLHILPMRWCCCVKPSVSLLFICWTWNM